MTIAVVALLASAALTFLVAPAVADGNPEFCSWTMQAAPPVAGGSAGPAVLTLSCPNHSLAGWSCGWKDGRSMLPVADPTPSTAICAFVSEDAAPAAGPCAKTWTWTVARPDFRTVTAWLQADMWKDEDCDGAPDDWNQGTPDGQCKYPNVYSPKVNSTPFPYQQDPDGKLDKCDQQHYEWQWRQFN